jgi:hypothetical protein
MSLICTTPYVQPPPPDLSLDKTQQVLYGTGRIEDYTNSGQMSAVFIRSLSTPYETNAISFNQALEQDYFYVLVPADYGETTFRDSNGMVGGFDGASWPLDDWAETLGGVPVYYNYREYLLYRTDWPGNWANTYYLSFENG